MCPTYNSIISINSYNIADTNSATILTTTTGTAVSTVTVSGVGYVNSTGKMAINITGATGFTAPLLITGTTNQSGTVTLTLNQTVNLPTIGAVSTLYYVNATTVSINITGAGNYVYPGYILYQNSVTPYTILTASGISGNVILTLAQSSGNAFSTTTARLTFSVNA